MRLLLTCLAVLLPTLAARAHGDFRPGYILPSSGDTIRGWVAYRAVSRLERECLFRRTPGEPTEGYGPGQLAGYGFDGDRTYHSRRSPEEEAPVFMEVLVQGRASLYLHKGRYYLDHPNREFIQLDIRRGSVNERGWQRIGQVKRFTGILRLYLSDCSDPDLSRRIDQASLRQPTLVALIEAYNTCSGAPQIVFKKNKPFARYHPGVIAGVHATPYSFDTRQPGDEYLEALEGDFRPLPLAGLQLVVDFPRLTERFAFLIEAQYLVNRYQGFAEQSFTAFIDRNDLYIDMRSLKVPLAARYQPPGRKLAPYLDLGISFTLNLSTAYHRIREVEIPETGTIRTEDWQGENIREGLHPGIWVGAGVRPWPRSGIFLGARLDYELDKVKVFLRPSRAAALGWQLTTGISF